MQLRCELCSSFTDFPDSLNHASKEIGLKVVPNKFVHAFLKNQTPKRFFDAEFRKKTYCLERLKEKKSKPKKRSRQGLTVKEKKELDLLKIGKNYRFESFLHIHKLWVKYMESVLPDKIPGLENDLMEVYQTLFKADYHGCFLVVCESKCPSYVGISGIVIMETRNTFKLVTTKNTVKTIPKHLSIFAFNLKNRIFKICGSNIQYLSYERSKIKFKSKYKTEIVL